MGMSSGSRPYAKHWCSQLHAIRCTCNAPLGRSEVSGVRQRWAKPMRMELRPIRRHYRPKPLTALTLLPFSSISIARPFGLSFGSSFGASGVAFLPFGGHLALSHHVGRLFVGVELDLLHESTTQQRHLHGSGASCPIPTPIPQITCHRSRQGRRGRP